MLCKIKRLLYILPIAVLMSGCDLINPPEEIPSYLSVDTIMIDGGAYTTSNVHEIQDVWVYVDGSLVGAYQAPFTIPVLPNGNHTVTLEPGIKESGQSMFRTIHPFVDSYRFDTLLSEKDTIKVNPVFKYYENIESPLNEDFESIGTAFEETESSDTSLMTINNNETINGNSGYIVLDEEHTQFDVRTIDVYDIPRTSKVILELEYYSRDANITAGVFAKEISGSSYVDVRYSVIDLFPDDKWRKVYIDLTEVVALKPEAIGFRIYFSAAKPEGTEGQLVKIYIDNIKLLHY